MSAAAAQLKELTTDAAAAGKRLDLFIGESLGLSRAKLKKLFEEGAVRVNGRVAKKGALVEAGMKVSVAVTDEDRAAVADATAELRVLHADDALVFIDKPAGTPSHPLRPGETGTIANALIGRFPECAQASEDSREGGLCHRLDIETSGVMVAARSREDWKTVREAFGGREIEKIYWALVTGPIADDGEIDLPLRHAGRSSDRVEAAADGIDARPAYSAFRVLHRQGEYSLVEVRIETGVMHQVRAHLAAIGASIVGDALYGGRPQEGLNRFFLHARRLGVKHPRTGEQVVIESALPPELERLAPLWTGSGVTPPSP